MKKVLSVILLLLSLIVVTSCSFQLNSYSKSYTYFDSYETITIWAKGGENSVSKYFTETNNILKKYHILTNRYEEETNNYGQLL